MKDSGQVNYSCGKSADSPMTYIHIGNEGPALLSAVLGSESGFDPDNCMILVF